MSFFLFSQTSAPIEMKRSQYLFHLINRFFSICNVQFQNLYNYFHYFNCPIDFHCYFLPEISQSALVSFGPNFLFKAAVSGSEIP